MVKLIPTQVGKSILVTEDRDMVDFEAPDCFALGNPQAMSHLSRSGTTVVLPDTLANLHQMGYIITANEYYVGIAQCNVMQVRVCLSLILMFRGLPLSTIAILVNAEWCIRHT
jgi:hypothetical protein